MNLFRIRRWSSLCVPACLAAALMLGAGPGLSQETGPLPPSGEPAQPAPEPVPGSPVQEGAEQGGSAEAGAAADAPSPPATEGAVGEVSTDELVGQLEASYKAYASVLGGHFRKPVDGEQDFEAVRSAVVTLATEGVEKVLSGNGAGKRMLACLSDLSQDGVMAAHLAALAKRSGRPLFVQEYLRAWCNVPLGSPYSRGKVEVPGAKVGKLTGDVVADRALVWLSADRGTVGAMNGHADPGEWVDLKFSITNRSKGLAIRGATARLAVRGDKDVLCPIWPPLEADAAAPIPPGCGRAVVVGPPALVGDLSPGERVTVGTFGLVLGADTAGTSVPMALLVEAPGAPVSTTWFTLPVGKPPLLEVAGLTVDDDGAGQSRGNGNGRIEPGERIELKARLAAVGARQLSKVAVSAHQYSGFLDLAPRVLGLTTLVEKKPAPLGGDFQFEVPTIDSMAAVPADRLDRQFFVEREVNLWIAASGCSGKGEVARDWATATPSSYLCPAAAPGYRYVLPIPLSIEFDQVLVINTAPVGARIKVNGVQVGETGKGVPVVFTQLMPVRNSILYYQVSAEAPGYETRVVEVPVIFKDRTADNLTSSLLLELEEMQPAGPVEPPVAVVEQPPFWEEAKAREEPVSPPEPPEASSTGGFFLQAGGAYRELRPDFEHADRLTEGERTFHAAGFEMGGGYQFGRFFFLSLDSSVLFPTALDQDGAFLVNLPSEDGETGTTSAKKAALYHIDSALAWTLCAQPGFQASVGPFSAHAGVGFQLEGMSADAPQPNNTTVDTPVRLTSVGYSARLSAGMAVRIVDGLGLYARGLLALPRTGMDWGITGGLRLDLF